MKLTNPTEHTMNDMKLYVALDVHKDSIQCGIAHPGRSKPEVYAKWGGSNLCVERGLCKLLKKHDLTKDEVAICYEAGPTGFVLARRLHQLKYHCIVIAPSKIPQKSGDRVKTDRSDCRKLAGYLRSGELTSVHIPPCHDEAVRDLGRARTDASEARTKCKQQLSMFLLRNGVRYSGKSRWTQGHMNYLRKYKFNDPSQQIVLEEYIIAISAAEERVKRLEMHMENQLEDWDKKPYVKALMALRGFKVVAAMTIVSEPGDLSRFPHPRQLMGFLGLVSSEESSGAKRRQGSITKCGNGHARWMLVESASHYQYEAKVTETLSRRQAGQSREVKIISWRAQNRLCYRFRQLACRRLNRNKVVVAIARELSAFIWELHHQVAKEITLNNESCRSSAAQ
ncbi:MAG: IS110 family transposase [Verrucomicrobiales bacterium]|nr:IS110 family transposase [Verrucomicrobiales bacterium]